MTNTGRTICCNGSYGPYFGSNADFVVYDSCNANNSSYTNLGASFVNDTGIDGRQVFTGEFNFKVKEIEVFAITAS
jgi:hypothetical protein